jgi:hypothetical protein
MACKCYIRNLNLVLYATESDQIRFRWASLQLQSLCELKTDEGVRERISRLSPKLEDLYLELYEKFNKYPAEADRQITKTALSWLLCTQRRLNSTEFLAAISMTPRRRFGQVTKEQVLDLCCNMVVFDSTLDTFQFSHLSVREFLKMRPEYTVTATNSLAAETCLLGLLSVVDNAATKKFLSEQEQPSIGSTYSHELRSYSTIYWATHCQLAADMRTHGVLKDFFLFFLSNESDPTSAFALWTGRLQEQLTHEPDGELYRRLEDTQAAAAATLFVACSFDFSEIVLNRLARQILRADLTNSRGLTALRVAVNHGSCEVILVLISNEPTQITEDVVKAAAGNWKSGTEIMRLLLDRRGADIQITEDVVKAAAGNWKSGTEIMRLLLDRWGAGIPITEDVVIAAAGNQGSGARVMNLLLDRWGADFPITEDVVIAAAGNQGSGTEVMRLLLDRRGADVLITKDVVKAVAENEKSGKEMMMLLR